MTKKLLAFLIVCLALVMGCTVSTSTSSGGLTVNDFKFGEGPEGPARSDPKFKQGEKVFTLFEVKGCKQGDDKKVVISEALIVTGPDGKEVINAPDISLIDKAYEESVDVVSGHNELTLPDGLPSGKYEVKMKLTDKNGGGVTNHNSSFSWEGSAQASSGQEQPDQPDSGGSGTLTVANFTFAESAEGPAREDKKFMMGEEVFLVFDIKGFKQDDTKVVWVQEDLVVTGPEGNVVLDEKNLLDLKDEAAEGADNVAANNKITLEETDPPGTYKVNLTVRDKVGEQKTTFQEEFEVVPAE